MNLRLLLLSVCLPTIFLLGSNSICKAQVPQSFSYQAVCRNTNGSPLLNQPIHFNIELLQGSITGTVVYAETQRDTTSAFGVSILEIGRGTPTTGTFAGINWANTPTFIRISFDATGGNNFIPLGTHELLSVPYALLSGNGLPNGSAPNQLLYWNGSAWVQLAPGNSGESLTMCSGSLYWLTGGVCPISSLSCSTSLNLGTLIVGVAATNVMSSIPYTGGTGGSYSGQIVNSTGVPGLTAILSGGSFANGNDSLVYNIIGTPSGSGTASFFISIGGQNCILTRTISAGSITTISCSTSTHSGILTSGVLASWVSSSIPYTGGNGGSHIGQTIYSTGVSGLTATFPAGNFSNGNGNLTYTISGTPSAAGTASFAISIGGQSCILTRTVTAPIGAWRPGMVHCSTPTQVVPVTNPITNKTWMDRNLGAAQVATSSTDANSYGDLFQWGRFGDGHQCRNSGSTSNLSSTDNPGNANFLLIPNLPNDWRNPQNNNLWQGINGTNNPCPIGYRLPTDAELDAERLSWTSNASAGAFTSPLKLPLGGYRDESNGSIYSVGSSGHYWSATVLSTNARDILFNSIDAYLHTGYRGNGFSVRCLND